MASAHHFLFDHSPNVLSFHLFLCFLLFVAVFAFWLTPGGLAWAISRAQAGHGPRIIGPSGLPLLGLVFAFKSSQSHKILSDFAKALRAEPLMAFSVGFTRFVVSSDPDSAREILNGSDFVDRPVKESAYGLLFHRAMGFAPYGEYWRNLRRVSAQHLFSPKTVSDMGEVRARLGFQIMDEIELKMNQNGEIEVKKLLQFGSLNNVMISVFGKWYQFGGEDREREELELLVREGYELLGIFNWGDHFPFLGWMDLQGVRKRSKKLVGRVSGLVGRIIEEHRLKRAAKSGLEFGDSDDHDFVDVLLDLEDENGLSDSDMIAVLWEMIFRGTDTVAILLEWILARIILHPEIQSKARHEINNITGPNRNVSPSDIAHLPYLHAIVKETLRLHPPGPLLSWARLAIRDTRVGPHHIPTGTTAMVNMWAITHDGRIWRDPTKFRPERFLDHDVPMMGSDIRLAPFGSGRRGCPGKTMGLATVHLWLAQLLKNFKWIHACDRRVDLSECLKLSMEMKHPLVCKAIRRRN